MGETKTEGPKLTPEQVDTLVGELLPGDDPRAVPVRFQVDSRTLNIESGHLQPRGINVMHQMVYWRFSRETSLKIAGWLGAKAVFDGPQSQEQP